MRTSDDVARECAQREEYIRQLTEQNRVMHEQLYLLRGQEGASRMVPGVSFFPPEGSPRQSDRQAGRSRGTTPADTPRGSAYATESARGSAAP